MRKKSLWLFFCAGREGGLVKVVKVVGRGCVSHQIIRYRDWLYKVLGRDFVSI